MTRKTPSRIKRELKKLRRRRDDDGDDGPAAVVAVVDGVDARGPEEGGPPRTDDADGFEAFRVDLSRGGEVETPGFPDPQACPECSTLGCENPALPESFGASSLRKCGTCLGIPDRDVPPAFRDSDAEGTSDGGDHE